VIDAIKLTLSHHISSLPVVDSDDKLIAILSEGDFVRREEIGTEKRRGRWLALLTGTDRTRSTFARQHGRKVCEIMTSNPTTIGEDTQVEEIVRLMESRNINRFRHRGRHRELFARCPRSVERR